MGARDAGDFAEFVAARSGALHRTAYLMVGEHALAQDLLQEALTKTYVAWPRLREVANAEAYTRRTITTTAISWRRKRSWHEQPRDELPVAVDVDLQVAGDVRGRIAPSIATRSHHQHEVAHVEIDRRDLLPIACEPDVRRAGAGEGV